MKLDNIQIIGGDQLSPEQRKQVEAQLKKHQERQGNIATETIFRDVEEEKVDIEEYRFFPKKFREWVIKQLVAYLKDRDPYHRRFIRIHWRTKARLMHPILRLFWKFLEQYVIKDADDIPKKSHNNHPRIFADSWEDGLEDFWKKFVYMLPGRVDRKKFPTAEIYYEKILKSKDTFQDKDSHARRSMLWKLWMTEILEDTADREWLNFFMQRLYWNMDHYYKTQIPKEIFGGQVPRPGEYPRYTSGKQNNPVYFQELSKHPLWKKPSDKDIGMI